MVGTILGLLGPSLISVDASRGASGDVQIKAYKFSEGFAAALRKQRFDTARYVPREILTLHH
jgi:hypothetical protein